MTCTTNITCIGLMCLVLTCLIMATFGLIEPLQIKRNADYDDQTSDSALIKEVTLKNSMAKLDCARHCTSEEQCSR